MRHRPQVVSGITRNLNAEAAINGRTCWPTRAPPRAAPTHSRPRGRAAWPRALTVGSSPAGKPSPVTRSSRPPAQPTISGLAKIARNTVAGELWRALKRANTSTQSRFTKGTMAALATAAKAMPALP
ncbi:hypothetical protein D3C79_817160 [compost metagenome]